jgi:hypothetical protein
VLWFKEVVSHVLHYLGLLSCCEHQDYIFSAKCIFGPENVFISSNENVK